MRHYFLTGGTGAIGSALVPVLLEQPNSQLALLIRAETDQQLSDRLECLFDFWNFADKEQEYRERIAAYRGDASLSKFGLEDTDYERLLERTSHIIHAAGAVRMNLAIEDARKSAVDSASHIMTLAEKCQQQGNLSKVDVVSTVGVGGRLPVVEEKILTVKREFHNTYEQAKAEAEEFIKSKLDQGLPITIHRPSMVVGDSVTGKIIHFQVFYHLCEFLTGRRTLGLFPDLGAVHLDTVPVDYVARVIAWSSMQTEMIGKVFHECSGIDHGIRLTDLSIRTKALFREYGLSVPPSMTLPLRIFNGILKTVAPFLGEKTRRALKTLPVFLEYFSSDQQFCNERTLAHLSQQGIALPRWEDYVDNVIKAYLMRTYATARIRKVH
jgi:thioester reductase-like protein